MIVLLATAFFFYRLCSLVEPSGTDGFFYLKQIQSLSESFQYYYHDYSIAFLFPAFFNVILRNPFLSYNLACAIVWGGVSWVTLKPLGRDWKAYVVIMIGLIIYSTNTVALELSLVFLKTGVAVLFALLAWDKIRQDKLLWALGLSVLSLLSHKTMLLVVPILWIPLFFTKIKFKRMHLATLPFIIILAAVAYPRIISQLTHVLQEGAFWEKFKAENLPKEHLLALIFVLASGGMLHFKRRNKKTWVPTIILLLPLFSPGLLNTEGLAFRFMVLAFPFLMLVIAEEFLEEGWRKIGSCILLLVVAGITWTYYRPLITWNQKYTIRVLNPDKMESLLPKNALVFAPHGVEFFLAYKTSFRPRSLRIEPKGRPVYRVAYVKPYTTKKDSLVAQDMEQMQVLGMGEFALFKEEDWLALNSLHQFIPHPMNLLPKKPDFISEYEN